MPRHTRIKSDDVLGAASTIAELAENITDLANVPIASTAASLVSVVLKAAKDVKNNDDARLRLARTAGTYLKALRPYLSAEDEESIPEDVKIYLNTLCSSLEGVEGHLMRMKDERWWKRGLKKDSIQTKLLRIESEICESYNAMMMKMVVDIRISQNTAADGREVISIGKSRIYINTYDHTDLDLEVATMGNVRFVGSQRASVPDRRVIVKFVARKEERDQELRYWGKIKHLNLPQLAGCSRYDSPHHFLLFYDNLSAHFPRETRSLAAFIQQMVREEDISVIVGTLANFMNEAIVRLHGIDSIFKLTLAKSAVRYMQSQLSLDDDQTAGLAEVLKFMLGANGHIIVAPPVQMLYRSNYGIANSVFGKLVPFNAKTRIQQCLVELDGAPSHTSTANAMTEAELEKWELLDAVSQNALRVHRDGVTQLHEFEIPETRLALIDYCPEIKPGTFGKLVPGRYQDYAFVALERAEQDNSALFSHQSEGWLQDRDGVECEVVRDRPWVWKVGSSTGRAYFNYIYRQWLTYPVHRSKRFLQLCCPQELDDVVFVVTIAHHSWYECPVAPQPSHSSPPEHSSPIPEVFVSEHETDGVVLSCCIPGICPASCDVHPKGELTLIELGNYTDIDFVRVPARCRSDLELQDSRDGGVVRHDGVWREDTLRAREFESIPYGCSPNFVNKDLFPSAEWPLIDRCK